MRDAVRTLCKSILIIRRHGLKRRIAEPESFLREVNALSMGMSAAGRGKPRGKKERKRILRVIKKVINIVEEHARRYREALDTDWSETDLTRKEAEVIRRRMDRVLDQLPEARRQAHERIIGERKIENADKILSLYDTDVHVIVRGKAGANVEFGNSLFLAENAEGFIIDHELKREASPGDSKWLKERYETTREKCARSPGGSRRRPGGVRATPTCACLRLTMCSTGFVRAICTSFPAAWQRMRCLLRPWSAVRKPPDPSRLGRARPKPVGARQAALGR